MSFLADMPSRINIAVGNGKCVQILQLNIYSTWVELGNMDMG